MNPELLENAAKIVLGQKPLEKSNVYIDGGWSSYVLMEISYLMGLDRFMIIPGSSRLQGYAPNPIQTSMDLQT